jgi:hypothetical protein
MRSSIPRIVLSLFAGCAAFALAGDAFAFDGPPAQAPQAEPGLGAPVDGADLEAMRGGEATVDASVLDQGTVDGNAATNVTSGLNSIDGGAFSHAAGITTVIQNSGSNVLVQNGTAVNLQFTGPTP